MKMVIPYFFIVLISCNNTSPKDIVAINTDTGKVIARDSIPKINLDTTANDTVKIISETKIDKTPVKKGSIPAQLLTYAQSLLGTPYKYASPNVKEGFDCSGFITHVFNHFNIIVPRSSVDFTNYGKPITTIVARPADLILFTGTDSSKAVGHMGIIVSNDNGVIKFIHSTSGKAYGVTITPLNDYYKGRFVKVIRVFNQNL